MITNFFFGKTLVPEGRKANPLKLDVTEASWSPDGQRVIFEAYEGEDRPIGLEPNLYLMKADGTDIYQLVEGVRQSRPRFTPDGRHIIFGRDGKKPVMVNLDGTQFFSMNDKEAWNRLPDAFEDMYRDLRKTFQRGGPQVTIASPSISQDGKKILAVAEEVITEGIFPQSTYGIAILSAEGEKVRWLLKVPRTAPSTDYWLPSWAPDEKRVVFVYKEDITKERFEDDQGLAVLDVATGKHKRLVEGDTPSWSPDGSWIAFEGGNSGGRGDIYVIAPDGRNLRRLTNATSPGLTMVWGSHPRWSPDGTKIVFRRGNMESNAGGSYVWTANRDGTGQVCVARSSRNWGAVGTSIIPRWKEDLFECLPSWRSDGKVLFTPEGMLQPGNEIRVAVSVANPDGTGTQALLTLLEPEQEDELCWSADGAHLAFDRKRNIWVAKGDGTEQRRIAGGAHPRWSPDGRQILFVQGSDRDRVLCVMDADGSNQTQITEPSHGYSGYHSWSPDGKQIAFEGGHGNAVYIVSVPGGDARCIREGAGQPCWSPDGKQIVFRSSYGLVEGHNDCIAVMNADGSKIRPVIDVSQSEFVSGVQVRNLAWAPDGESVLFEEIIVTRSLAGGAWGDQFVVHRIWIVDVREPVFYVLPK
jgi:Tol biopolymer transport system component